MTAQPLAAQPVEAIPQQAAPAPVVHQPPPMHMTPYPHKSGLESMFGTKLVTVMVFVGVILLFIGALLCINAKVVVDTDFDDVKGATEDSFAMYKTGAMIMVVGNMLITMFLLGAAVINTDIAVNVRVGFMVFSAIMIFVTVTLVMGYITPLLQTGPTIIS